MKAQQINDISFQEFLIEKNKESDKIDWSDRKEKWLSSVDALFAIIKEWMEPFQKNNLIQIVDNNTININEEFIGNYEIKRLDLYVGKRLISLIPKGTLIYGFVGRIDMTGPKGDCMILEPKWGSWKISSRLPKTEPWNFTKESFEEIIKEII